MTKKLENQRQEQIRSWQEKYKHEIKSCLDEVKAYESEHPDALKCIIKRKKTSKEFKIALCKSCEAEDMVAKFGWFGKIEVWFNKDVYIFCQF